MRLINQAWVVVFALSFSPVFGQETKPVMPRDKVAKILDLQFSQQAFMAAIENTVPQFIANLRVKNPGLTLPQVKQLTDIYKQTQLDTRIMNRDAAIDGWIETYTEDEIDALYKFYTAPLGTTIAAKQPTLTLNTQSKTRVISQTIFGPELARRIKADPMLKDLTP
jgi:hypothetical protein